MNRALQRVQWAVGVVWFLSWFELYLEFYRYRHVAPPRMLGLPAPALAVGAGARPGGFLRTVLACSALAPVVFVALWLVRRARQAPAGVVRLGAEPAFPMAWVVGLFGLGLCVAGTINQLVRRPPITVDLTLRTGNGGFMVVGAALVLAGWVLRLARGGPLWRHRNPSERPP